MMNKDLAYHELLQMVTDYLSERRKFAVEGTLATTSADSMVQAFNKLLPRLAGKLGWSLPNVIYSKQIINFSVSGLHDSVYQTIWISYYLDGQSLRYVASLIKYTERNTKRLILKFPHLIVEQLIEKDHETYNSNYIDPMTISQRKIFQLMRAFGITVRQAEILVELIDAQDEFLGQNVLCAKLSLSPSGLKKHVRRIIRKMNVSNRQQAVEKAKNLFMPSEPE